MIIYCPRVAEMLRLSPLGAFAAGKISSKLIVHAQIPSTPPRAVASERLGHLFR